MITMFLLQAVWWFVWSLTFYFALVVCLTAAYRSVKIILARRNKRQVSGQDAVLITGATSGIGLAVAKYLYKLGYSVIAGYYDSREAGFNQLKQLANDKSRKSDQKLLFVEFDVRKQESISKAFSECSDALEQHNLRLYALINNAGLGSLQPFAWLQRQTIRNMIDTNLLGTLMMTREFLPLIIKSSGRILNVSSGLGLFPGSSYITYGITKSSQVYFTRSLNLELKSTYGVKSIAVIPHNYIKNTNICSNNVKNNELAWEELTPLERQIYEKEFREHCRLAKALEVATKEHSIQASEQKSKPVVASRTADPKNWIWLAVDTLKKVINRLNGENVALTLEDSGALECFEDALRLEDPPEHIFAGDSIYNILIGSFILSLPPSCTSLFGSSLAPSLYK